MKHVGVVLDRCIGMLSRAFNVTASLFVSLIMFLVVSDIIGRYFFNSPLPMNYEINSFLMVMIVFLSLTSLQRSDDHIRISVFTHHLSPFWNAWFDILAYILGLILYIAIAFQGIKWTWASYMQGDIVSGAYEISKWPSQIIIPIGAILLSIQYLADILRNLFFILGSKSPRNKGK